MPQDAFTLRILCKELNAVLSGGKINRIIQPENERVEFTVYTGKNTEKLVLDVKPSSPRIGITEEERETPITAPNFCMLLRKHLLGATISRIEIVGYDRVVKITCLAGGEFSDFEEKVLYVELMGRYSNIILTENGKVLGGNRGINFFDNGVRPLIVGRPYVGPPSGGKKTPDDENLIEYFNSISRENLAKHVADGLQGVAVSTAEEIVRRYKKENFDGADFYVFIKNFLYGEEKNPCVAVNGGKTEDVFVFPYKTVQAEYKYFPALYLAEDYYFINKEKERVFLNKKNEILSCVNAAVKKRVKKLSLLMQRKKEAEKAEEYKIKGELILSNIYKINRGDKTLVAFNYYDNTETEISLDVSLSPALNAENYFKKYNKQKRAMQNIVSQEEIITSERDYYVSVKEEAELAETVSELDAVRDELVRVGALKNKKITGRKKTNVLQRVYVIDGFTVRAGRNNVENDEITSSADKRDVWVHAKDFHSSHLIIETRGKPLKTETLIKAAQICAYYSKGREGGKTEIVYTEKKNVKKPSGAKPGFFVYENYSSLTVKPEKHAELLKKE